MENTKQNVDTELGSLGQQENKISDLAEEIKVSGV